MIKMSKCSTDLPGKEDAHMNFVFRDSMFKPSIQAISQCVQAGVIILILMILSLATHADEKVFDLKAGNNAISLPFTGTGIIDAESLAQAIPYCLGVTYWDTENQQWVTHHIATPENNFSVVAGYPYFVNVSQDTQWMLEGETQAYLLFDLVTTETTNVNAIAMPMNRRLDITDISMLGIDIPNADALWYLPAGSNNLLGHPVSTDINSDLQVAPGDALLVSVTEESQWPLDVEDPLISIDYPVDGTSVNLSQPQLQISFSDQDSGVDSNSLLVELNGVDISAQMTKDQSSASIQLSEDLPVGSNNLIASISDYAGRSSQTSSSFTVVGIRAIPGASPTSGTAPLRVYFSTDGVDPSGTIQVFRWDYQGDGIYDTYDTVATNKTYSYNTPGTYQATLFVQSSSGETATASIEIIVENNPPTVTADVSPSNGGVPLDVQMTGSASDIDGSIVLYEWDFEGDGVFDYASATDPNISHVYTIVGEYQSVFRATDDKGATATAIAVTTAIRAAPSGSPTATATANTLSGNAPLNVNLGGSGSGDNAIVLYEWDFDNDGVFDYSSASNAVTSHTYTTAGSHVATLQVTDSVGLTGIDQLLFNVNIQTSLSVSRDTIGFPKSAAGNFAGTVAASSVYSSSPHYQVENTIDGKYSTYWISGNGKTPANGFELWFEGQFNKPHRVRSINFEWYTRYKMTNATLELFDNLGTVLFSQQVSNSTIDVPSVENVARIRITAIDIAYSRYVVLREFSVDGEVMDTGGGTEPEPTGADINTSISASSTVSVLIKNEDGGVIRRLVDKVFRPLGSYQDYWDVRDDNGLIVRDSTYYAVLEYDVDGVTKSLDLTGTTGGSRISPTRQSTGGTRSNPVAASPYEDSQLPVRFSIAKASEITLFVGYLFTSNTRVRTILNRVTMSAGSHTVYWDGLDDNENIALGPPGNNLILGIWAYSLPNNAMYVTGGRPEVSNVKADPNYFSPFSETCDSTGLGAGVLVDFTLSENVAITEMRVYSLNTGALLRTSQTYSQNAGDNTVFWDGKNNAGEYVDIGEYQIGVIAIDADGNESMLTYTLVKVDF